MTYRINDPYEAEEDTEYEPEPAERSRRRWPAIAMAMAALALSGVASAFIWRAYGGSRLVPPWFTSTASAPSSASEFQPIGLKEFQTLQQQIAAQTQTTNQYLSAQQAELKRLSDQIVAVAAKLNALQSVVPPELPSQPAANPVPTPKKKPAASKPANTGGATAPLQLSR